MTNVEMLAKIKAEIEKLKTFYGELHTDFVCEALLSFLSALESEQKKEVKPCHRTRKRLAEWSKTPEGRESYEKVAEEMRNEIAITNNPEESEKPTNQKGLDVTDFCKPIDPGIAQCIADHSWEMLGEDEKPVPADLEEAASEYSTNEADRVWGKPDPHDYTDHSGCGAAHDNYEVGLQVGFKAGSKWDRSQMMKEGVECETVCIKDRLLAVLPMKEFRWTVGDKVRVIVLPKEDEK